MNALEELQEKDKKIPSENMSWLEMVILDTAINAKGPRLYAANKSAAELADKNAVIEAAREFVMKNDANNGDRYDILLEALAKLDAKP